MASNTTAEKLQEDLEALTDKIRKKIIKHMVYTNHDPTEQQSAFLLDRLQALEHAINGITDGDLT
jgi:hypothetical protein